MFRHKPASSPDESEAQEKNKESKEQEGGQKAVPIAPVKSEGDSLKELMEKNLKWSQIIYEQNRKIHRKLVWAAVASWIKLLLILVPLALAIWYLPPMLKGILDQYGSLLGIEQTGGGDSTSLENLLKMLNLDPAKQEQLKGLLK